MKEVTFKLSDEELFLLAGILYYSEGEILTNVYNELTRDMTPSQLQIVRQIAREIAITGNGYYIDELDLIYKFLLS